MFRLFHKIKGQSTLEYAILIIIIIGALLTIQVYIKRGVQGRLKSATDDIGDQYSPGNTNTLKTTVTTSNTAEFFGRDAAGVAAQGQSVSRIRVPEITNTSDKAQIANVDQEYWGKDQPAAAGGGNAPVLH